MKFFRMIKMDFKRMFLSGKFYFAIAGAMLVTVLNLQWQNKIFLIKAFS